MADAAPRRLARSVRSLSPRAAVLIGGALMVAGQLIFALMVLSGVALPSLDASAVLVVPALLTGIAMLWLGPVVVATPAGRPAWIGVIAFPCAYAVWVAGVLWAGSLPDGAVLTIVEGSLSVISFVGALAVVSAGRVWRRFVGVAVIAGLTGMASYLLRDVSGVVHVGLVMAVGFLAWMSPRARPPRPSETSDVTASSPPA